MRGPLWRICFIFHFPLYFSHQIWSYGTIPYSCLCPQFLLSPHWFGNYPWFWPHLVGDLPASDPSHSSNIVSLSFELFSCILFSSSYPPLLCACNSTINVCIFIFNMEWPRGRSTQLIFEQFTFVINLSSV